MNPDELMRSVRQDWDALSDATGYVEIPARDLPVIGRDGEPYTPCPIELINPVRIEIQWSTEDFETQPKPGISATGRTTRKGVPQ